MHWIKRTEYWAVAHEWAAEQLDDDAGCEVARKFVLQIGRHVVAWRIACRPPRGGATAARLRQSRDAVRASHAALAHGSGDCGECCGIRRAMSGLSEMMRCARAQLKPGDREAMLADAVVSAVKGSERIIRNAVQDAAGMRVHQGTDLIEMGENIRAMVFLFAGVCCGRCGGYGHRAYPSTAGWRGGIGGQAITRNVCDSCWGTGRNDETGADLRKPSDVELADRLRTAARADAGGELIGTAAEIADVIDFDGDVRYFGRHLARLEGFAIERVRIPPDRAHGWRIRVLPCPEEEG